MGITLGLAFLPRLVYPPLTNEQLQGVGDALLRLQFKGARSALEIEFCWQMITIIGMFLGTGAVGFWMWSKKRDLA
ncbi:hypothetical protein [Streptosporangium subroseum]|uniref:hypothetical protein n=1 Tax=Streptosporangium subroseum TaxID=106412 RepID=UPI00308ABFC9|nr:hypothetical protein OHB15_43240 [Streptosporangium subroseum]